MSLIAPVELRGLGLSLRRLTAPDAGPLGEFLEDRDNTRFMTFPDEVTNRVAARAIVDGSIDDYALPSKRFALAIAHERDPQILGVCGTSQAGDDELEIFYLVFKSFRRRGIAGRAAEILTRHLRETHPACDLTAFVNPENVASARILIRLGFSDAGPTTENGRTGRRYALARIV
jgi:RimJ/RimL family protein N-acetyltransferase